MTEGQPVDYRAILQKTARPEDSLYNNVLPVRRFVRAVLGHQEELQFSTTVVAFSDAAYKVELGIEPHEYYMLQASKVAEIIGTSPNEVSRASEVARSLWEEYKKLTGIAREPVRVYEPLSPEAAARIQNIIREQREGLKGYQDRVEEEMASRESLTKRHMVGLVARKTGQTKKAVEETIDAFLEKLVDQMLNGKRVVLQGFGSFKVTRRSERRVLSHGVERQAPAHNYPQFTPGKTLKREIRVEEDTLLEE